MGLGSGIWKKPIPDPGSRGQKSTEYGSATLHKGFLFIIEFQLNEDKLLPISDNPKGSFFTACREEAD
jgi:hypothetical protein